jgi:hypothetical protein
MLTFVETHRRRSETIGTMVIATFSSTEWGKVIGNVDPGGF